MKQRRKKLNEKIETYLKRTFIILSEHLLSVTLLPNKREHLESETNINHRNRHDKLLGTYYISINECAIITLLLS